MNRHPGHAPGFTLVELMVSLAVVSLLVALLAAMLGGVSTAWLRSRQSMDNFAKGRALINALDGDLRSAVIRQDLVTFPGTGGVLAFYARQYGQDVASGNMRALTFVSFSQQEVDGEWELVRQDAPFDFQSTNPPWIDPTAANATPPTSSISRTMAPGVYSFVYHFIETDGSEGTTFNDASAPNPTKAVRISLAILSAQADSLLKATNQQNSLKVQLDSSASTASTSVEDAWDTLLTAGRIAASFPHPVAEGLRFYERVVPLTPSGRYVHGGT